MEKRNTFISFSNVSNFAELLLFEVFGISYSGERYWNPTVNLEEIMKLSGVMSCSAVLKLSKNYLRHFSTSPEGQNAAHYWNGTKKQQIKFPFTFLQSYELNYSQKLFPVLNYIVLIFDALAGIGWSPFSRPCSYLKPLSW